MKPNPEKTKQITASANLNSQALHPQHHNNNKLKDSEIHIEKRRRADKKGGDEKKKPEVSTIP